MQLENRKFKVGCAHGDMEVSVKKIELVEIWNYLANRSSR